MHELVAASTAVEVSLRPFTEEDGKQVFRLAMLREAEKTVKYVDDREEYKRRLEAVRASRTLEQYFRSAAGLAKLWVLLGMSGGRDELRNLVGIKMRGTVVPWSRFFFDLDDAPKFADALEAKRITHPAALVVHIRKLDTVKQGASVVAYCTVTPVSDGPPRVFVGASIFGTPAVMQRFQEDRHYVVVGTWYRGSDKTRTARNLEGQSTVFQNISINIYQLAQYAEVSPPEE